MLSLLFYIYCVVLCTIFMILSAVALVLTWPFDKARRTVHELSRILVKLFFATPPRWHKQVEGMQYVDRRKSYVIVLNHSAMTDIPALYYVPLNFRWVSKREVFRLPFFGQFLKLHGDICIDRGRGSEAMEQLLHKGKLWLSRGASVAIFPEGTRSKDGEIHRFKAGAFALAQEAGVEILPIVLDGTTTLVKKSRLFNWKNTIKIHILQPVPAAEVRATDTKELMESVRTRMVEALAEVRGGKTAAK